MVVLVVVSGNELILGMSLMKMLKRIGPSIEPWGTYILYVFSLCPCNDVIEDCTLNIKLRSREVCVVALYRPLSGPINEFTDELFVLLQSDKR